MGGRVLFDASRRVNLPPEARRVGYVFQEYALFPHMTVRANVHFAGPAVDGLLRRFGILHLADAYPGTLSGGERQRVALARALASEPDVLLLDEPLSALDAHTRDSVRGELRELLGELSLPALLVTHDFEDAASLADRVGVIVAGEIRQMGSPEQLLDEPEDAFVASFVGTNLLPGEARAMRDGLSEVTLDQGGALRAPAVPDGRVGALVHPWDISVDPSERPAPRSTSCARRSRRSPPPAIACASASARWWPRCRPTTPAGPGWRRGRWCRPASRPRRPGWCPSAERRRPGSRPDRRKLFAGREGEGLAAGRGGMAPLRASTASAPVKIVQTRISRLSAHLLGVPRGSLVTPALCGLRAHMARIVEIGFPRTLAPGQVLLPAVVGRRSAFNADGEDRPRRDRPKEAVAALTSVRRHRDARESEERAVHARSYVRYPRTRVPAPNVELCVVERGNGDLAIVTEAFRRGEQDDRLMHAVNLLLEIFGECVLLKDNPIPSVAVAPSGSRLNWEVLAEASVPDLYAPFASAVDALPPPERAVARYRLQQIVELGPDFVAVGRGGYRGCGAFGFGDRGRFVIESAYHDNATHVTSRTWDDLSRFAKSELLVGLPGDRAITHSRGWETRLRDAVGVT